MNRGRIAGSVVGLLLAGSGLACINPGASGPTGAAILATTAVAATLGYRKLTNGCVSTCSKDWHCDHASGFCKPDAKEDPYRLARPAVDAGVPPPRENAYRLVRPAVDAGAPPADAGR